MGNVIVGNTGVETVSSPPTGGCNPGGAGLVLLQPQGILYTCANGTWTAVGGGGGGAPSGPAGGDLVGTYPNPTVNGIAAATLPLNSPQFNITGTPTITTGGLYFPSNNSRLYPSGSAWSFTINSSGTAALVVGITGTRLPSNSSYGFSSNTGNGGATDTTLSRLSAGVVQIGSGLANGNNGFLSLAEVQLTGDTPAPSASQLLCTTAPYTAGTGATNLPVVYLNSGATAPTTLSAAGTTIGVNAPAGFTGNFLDFRVNGAGSLATLNSGGIWTGQRFADANSTCGFLSGSFRVGSTSQVAFVNVAQYNGVSDVSFSRQSVGIVQVGSGATSNSQGSLALGQAIGGSGSPAIAAGTGAGTAPTVSLAANSSNLAGSVSVTVGTAPASGPIVTITFANAFAFLNVPFSLLSPGNANAAALTGPTQVFSTETTTTIVINAGPTALTAGTQYVWKYHIVG